MNIFTGLLFQHGYIVNADLAKSLAGTPAEDYGRTYGNRVANEKQFRESWDKHKRDPALQSMEHPEACVGCG